jgi:23S rRNA (pseudouridine1915-N3)-methyltransferase
MKIQIISVGKKNDSGISDAINDFTERIGHYAPIEWKIVPSGNSMAEEGKSISPIIDPTDYVILLDEKGKAVSSLGLAQILANRLNASTKKLVFIIGGAFGVSDEVKNLADMSLSFSQLTFPHQIVRLILTEQIYRAFTILRGEKYHHM